MKVKSAVFLLLIIVICAGKVTAQGQDYRLGSDLSNLQRNNPGGFYDYSDAESVNIMVAVWGFVKFPGKYRVPITTNVSDLLSYAGGPTDAAHLDEMKLYRTNVDSTQQLIKLNYDDILWETNLSSRQKKMSSMEAGDVLIVPGAPRIYTRESVGLWLSILSTIISLSILVLNIVRK